MIRSCLFHREMRSAELNAVEAGAYLRAEGTPDLHPASMTPTSGYQKNYTANGKFECKENVDISRPPEMLRSGDDVVGPPSAGATSSS